MLPPIPSSPDYSLLIIIPLVEYRLHANGHLLSTVITVRNYEQWPCTVKCYARTFVSLLENDFYPPPPPHFPSSVFHHGRKGVYERVYDLKVWNLLVVHRVVWLCIIIFSEYRLIFLSGSICFFFSTFLLSFVSQLFPTKIYGTLKEKFFSNYIASYIFLEVY